MNAAAFMKIVGVIEIIAGVIVLIRPLIDAYAVMAWLISIALVLVTGGNYYDVGGDIVNGNWGIYPWAANPNN